jgi:hypothetical protein
MLILLFQNKIHSDSFISKTNERNFITLICYFFTATKPPFYTTARADHHAVTISATDLHANFVARDPHYNRAGRVKSKGDADCRAAPDRR